MPAVNVMPEGNVPACVNVGVGVPLVVTVKVNGWPAMAVAEPALVIASPLLIVRTKLWVAVPTKFAAAMVSVYVPWLPAAGVPDRVAVPLPLSLKVTPGGSAGLESSVIAAVGKPVVVTEKLPAVATGKVADGALVITGAAVAGLTVRVKLWLASGLTPFDAVIVIG